MRAMIALTALWMLIVPCVATVTPTPSCTSQYHAEILEPLDGAVLILTTHTIKVAVGDKALELKINGDLVVNTSASGPPHAWEYEYAWLPAASGIYTIAARSLGYSCPNGSPWDEIQVTILAVSTQLDPAIYDLIPVYPTCMVEAQVNLFCRSGPSQAYPDLDSLTPGQQALIIGRSSDGMYWYVIGPNLGQICTVPDQLEFVQLTGADCGAMPVFTPPPTPRPEEGAKPTPCPQGLRCP